MIDCYSRPRLAVTTRPNARATTDDRHLAVILLGKKCPDFPVGWLTRPLRWVHTGMCYGQGFKLFLKSEVASMRLVAGGHVLADQGNTALKV